MQDVPYRCDDSSGCSNRIRELMGVLMDPDMIVNRRRNFYTLIEEKFQRLDIIFYVQRMDTLRDSNKQPFT